MSNVPKLRFKEFSGEWEEKYLLNIGKIITGSTPSTDIKEYYNGNKLFVSPSDVNVNRFIESTKTTLTELGFSKGRKVDKYSVCFICIGSTIGKVGQLSEDSITNQQINCITANKNNSNNFIYSLLEKYAPKIKLLAGVQALPQINKTDFSKFKFKFPHKQEQEKIASFLTSIDSKIEQLTKKESLLQEYKKGVMQKIFSQEIRFKDDEGSEFCEWETKRLEEISLTYYQGINTAADNVRYFKHGYPILQAKHITNEFIDFFDTKYLNENDYNNYKNKYKPNKNDILISNIGTLGKVVLIENDVDFLVAWNIFKITLNLKKVNSKYLMFIIKKISSEGYFERKKTGNATKFVNKTDMINLKIKLPCLEEQLKIANFLSSIDKKNELLLEEIENTKKYKKSLLQNMFI